MSSAEIFILEILSLENLEILKSQCFSVKREIHFKRSLFRKTRFSHVKNIRFDFFIIISFFKLHKKYN
ncbi:TPA: hypothetical protein DCZ31_03280 [Patescibacteria group bacterium]|nr:hypothetical protein [Candidatus Gracilibacteria bacterium]